MRSRTFILIPFFLLFLSLSLHANTYFMLTEIGTSARTIGQGYVEGFGSDSNSIFENPAGLHRVEKGAFAFFSTILMNEIEYRAFSMASSIPWGKIGLGYMEAVVTGIPRTVESGNRIVTLDTFDYRGTLFKVAYQTSFTSYWHVGASMVFYGTSFATISGSGMNIDVGSILDFKPVMYSFFVRNPLRFNHVTFNTGRETLPLQLLGGLSVQLNPFSVLAQLKNDSGTTLSFLGITYTPPALPFIYVLGGRRDYKTLQDVRSNYTFGIGFSVEGFSFNTAYEKSEVVEFDHKIYFSMGLNY